jgi:hypothetical protein
VIVRRAVRLVQKTGRARLGSFRTALAGRLTVPYLWCSWSDRSPSRWAQHVTTSQGRSLSEPVALKANTLHEQAYPLRGCNSDLVQYSNTQSLRAAGFEDEDDDEDSLSDVAFCARWLAVLSASEVGRTRRAPSACRTIDQRLGNLVTLRISGQTHIIALRITSGRSGASPPPG